MVYPACSDHEWVVTEQGVTPSHNLETEQLNFDGLFERRMRCAPGLRRGFGADQKPVVNSGDSGHNQLGKVAECVGAFDLAQDQEITQDRKVAPGAAED
jgi:hypothetical protein